MIPDFADHVSQLAMGLCVALEVRAENAVRTFRETAGPWDVEMAKVGPHLALLLRHEFMRIKRFLCCGSKLTLAVAEIAIFAISDLT